MFERKTTKTGTDQLGQTNRIVEGTTIKGNFSCAADTRIDGTLEGDFTSEGKLVIGPAGKFIGNIICTNCDIEGYFQGNLTISETLNLKSNAIVNGKVTFAKLSVEPGAEFNTTCVMKSDVKNLKTHAKTTEKTA